MIFDATKVTYNTYSCAISGMSRERIKMDGRDSTECQNWENWDIIGILGFVLNEEKDKIGNSAIFPKLKVTNKMGRRRGLDRGADFLFYF